MEAIFCAVSAANSCELCLTFHAMGLEKHGASKEDINAIVHQGQPTSKDILGHVYCAKLALAHKGVFLEREKEYLLKEFGLGSEHVCEIIYLVGQISANNFLMVHMIANGVPVDDILTGLSPFSKTAYGK
jgi:AhpD family alkylhydroperoxidase